MGSVKTSGFVIKVCGITSEQDALAAASAGSNAIGLNFYPRSPRFVTMEQARRIAAALPPDVLRVGVFVNECAEHIIEIAATVRLDIVQLHGSDLPVGLPSHLRVWRALSVNEQFSPELAQLAEAEAVLLDSPTEKFGGSGKVFEWSRVAGIRGRVVLAGGLDGSNVGDAIAEVRPWGVDACSRLESARGRKSETKVREFVNAALAAYAALQREAEPLVVR